MKKITYIPQFSMNDGTKSFIVKDGNFIVLKTVIKYIKKIYNDDFLIKIALPNRELIDNDNYHQFIDDLKLLSSDKIKFQYFHLFETNSPILNRYIINYSELVKQVDSETIIFNNIPEISRNIRAYFPKIKLISLHHFCDYINEGDLVNNWENGELFNYFYRQIDGMLSSDYNIFNCKSSMDGWINSIKIAFNKQLSDNILKKHMTYISYVDLSDYETYTGDKFENLTTIFSARITNSLYTNWIPAFKMFLNDNTRGRIIFCNPSYSKGISCIKDNFNEKLIDDIIDVDEKQLKVLRTENNKIFIVNENMDRETYLKLAGKSHVNLNLYTSEYYGGIGARETVKVGYLLPFHPNIYEYAKWYKDVVNENELIKKIDSIDELITKFNSFIDTYYMDEKHGEILKNFENIEDYTNYIDNFKTIQL